MERILVLGPCGSGKSWLSRRLGDRWGLPVIHLDQEHWRPGWVEAPKDEMRARIEELIARPRWLMDGNYGSSLARRLERAQLVIDLDYPRHVFFPRMLWRVLSQHGRTRADMAPDCPERLDWEFIKYTWRYRTDALPRREARIVASGVPVLRFGSPQQTAAWLAAGAPLPG